MADPLAIYLNDHLAASVAALRMMETLAAQADGSPLAEKLRTLRAEVSEEQRLLRALLERIDASENRLTQAAAWMTEKVGEGKLALAGRAHPALALLQGLESLALGLQGKLALYRVLGDLELRDSRLAGPAYAALEARTVAQHAMVEHERIAAARAALGVAAAERA